MPADADEARRLAEEILSRQEYQEPSTPWWQKVLEWIDELYQRTIGTLSGSGGGSVLGWVVVVLVGIAVVAVVVLAVRTLRRSPRTKKEEQASEPRRKKGEERVDWNEQATQLEAEGRWRDGLRARYRALVGELSRRRVVDPALSRTTGEHRHEVGSNVPDAAVNFADAAELFDRAWYGGRDTGPEEAARFGQLATSVADAAAERRSRAKVTESASRSPSGSRGER